MPAISTAIAVAGLGLSAAGAYSQYEAGKESAEASRNIAGFEMQQERVRQKAMELQARRQQMEVVRNQQRARSLALTAANSQNASTGSGLQGGYGQISGQTGVNLLGISQNLEFGEQMFSLNSQIGQQKMNIADAQSQYAFGSGLSSLGGALINNAGTLGNLSKGFGFGANPVDSYSLPQYIYGNRVMGPR